MKKYLVAAFCFSMSCLQASQESIVVRPTLAQRQNFKNRHSKFHVFVFNKFSCGTVPIKVMESRMLYEAAEDKKMHEHFNVLAESLRVVHIAIMLRDEDHDRAMKVMHDKMLKITAKLNAKLNA